MSVLTPGQQKQLERKQFADAFFKAVEALPESILEPKKETKMICDIIIRSYSGDFEWLAYCLRSIERFAKGFRRTVVIVPNGHNPPTGTNETVFHVEQRGNQYLQQQSDKLHADAFSYAEYLLYMDSDTIFTRPIRPEDVIVVNEKSTRPVPEVRPLWLYTPYTSLNDPNTLTWQRVVGRALKRVPENEFMRRHPLCVPRWALEELRHWFWRAHGQSLESYIMSQPGSEFSEWNVIGAWLWYHHHNRIAWQNTDEELGVPFVHQHYSWGGLNDDIRRNLEAALA